MRRGAADRRWIDRAVAWWWGSRLACWRWPHRRAVMVAERRRRCLPQEHGSASGRPSACRRAQLWGRLSWLGRPVRILGQRPRVRCPASSVRSCDVRASGVQCPGVSGCPGCPASVSAFRVRCVRTGDFVERVGASVRRAATRSGHGSGRPAGLANGSGNCPSQSRGLYAGVGGAGPAATSGWTWSWSWRRLGSRAGFDRLAGQGPPVGQDRPLVWSGVWALGTPSCDMAARRSSGQGLAACGRP
jgi:hypothetical protein